MTAQWAGAGLCGTCSHAGDCSLRAGGRGSTYECEEYEPGAVKSLAATAEVATGAGVLGLCVDCDGRETCSFPRPEGGVWHCEEYSTG